MLPTPGPEFITFLQALIPARGLLHVGGGRHLSLARYEGWDLARLVVVEAVDENAQALLRAIQRAGRDGWTVLGAILAERSGTHTFYHASNGDESGLVPPDRLAALWQNLHEVERRTVQATTIAALLADMGEEAAHITWGVIDCFPALPILRGAGRWIAQWDVVLARAVIDDKIAMSMGEGGLGKGALDAFMTARGFRKGLSVPGKHPAVGQVIYVRDWKGVLHARLAEARREWTQAQAALVAKVTGLETAGAEMRARQAQRERRLAELVRRGEECAAVVCQKEEELRHLRSQLSRLREARAREERGLQECRQRLSRLTKEREALERDRRRQEKLCVLKQQDLEDLRRKYRLLHEENEARAGLLAELRRKLLAASRHVEELRGKARAKKEVETERRGIPAQNKTTGEGMGEMPRGQEEAVKEGRARNDV